MRPIGVLRTPFVTRADCPRNGRQLDPSPPCEAVVFDEFAPGLNDLDGFSHLILLYWLDQILPIRQQTRKGEVVFDTDEHVRHEAKLEDFEKLKPVFQKDGTVTAGNASGINDGAAAVVLMERSVAEKRGLKPMARLVSYGHAGVDPKVMGIGPVPATRIALERAKMTVRDLDVIEANEAFAAQACAVTRGLDLDPAKVNPNGSGISLGHPVGATGVRLVLTALKELQRRRAKRALVTLCVGGGQGAALWLEKN